MNRLPDVEPVLRAYLADSGDRAPDRVLTDVAARIARQPRSAWRLRGRSFVNTYTKLAAGLAAVLVVGFVGWQLLPGISGPGSPSIAPSPSVRPSAAPTAAQSAAPTVASSPSAFQYPTTGILNPGKHTTQFFAPAFTFSVSDVWINDGDKAQGPGQIAFYSLFPDNAANRAEWARSGSSAQGILIARLASPYYYCDSWEENSGATAAEMLAKVTGNTAIETTGVVDVEIGGLTGKQFDLRLAPDWTETCPGDPPGTDLADTRTRSILLDTPGSGVIVFFITATHAADFDAYLAVAMPFVESIEFTTGQ